MRVPDPKANTTTEAYLAYKAGYLEESELKPVLYEPYLHFDAWLAYWAGLTNEYPIDKNGDPEMLTDEEALVAYLAGVTDTYPEEIKDPYDVRIVGYLRHLASIRWPEPDYPVNNEEFYLSTMEPTHTSNPEPSSDIELDTAEGKIINVEAYGDTYQQTYSGTNLFNNKTMTNKTISGDVTIIDDNSFTMYDDGTGGGWKYVAFEVGGITPNTDYSMKFTQVDSKGTSTNTWINVRPTGGSAIVNQTYASGTQIHFNSGEGTTSFIIQFYAQAGAGSVAANTATVSNIQLNVGNSTVAYEPYVGGIPAPNPDYPQDVQVVTGAQTVKLTGKNLLTGGYTSTTDRGIDRTWDNVYVTLSGETTSSYSNISQGSIHMPVEPGTYTFSTDSVSDQFTKNIRFSYGGTNYTFAIAKGESSVTFTIPDDATDALFNLLFISGFSTGMQIEDSFGLMLEKSPSPTDFQPYLDHSYKLSLMKNLFDVSTFEMGGMSNGHITSSTTRITNINNPLKVSPNTKYTISVKLGGDILGFRIGVHQLDENKTFISDSNWQQLVPDAYTFTTGATTEYIGIVCSCSVTSTVVTTNGTESMYSASGPTQWLRGCQLFVYNEGDSNIIELCKIGNYQDYIYKSGDDWYVHKACGKQIVDTSNIVLRDTYTNVEYALFGKPTDYGGYGAFGSAYPIVCTHAIHSSNPASWDSASNAMRLYSGAETFRLWIGFAKGTGLDTIKTKLTGCINYYALGTPTDTKITDATLISQLNALKEGGSYNGKTYITVTSTAPNLPALLKVEAYKY